MELAPVITIDGPSGVGKGTVTHMLAKALGWYMLDSGAIYRAIGWALLHYQVSPDDEAALKRLLLKVQIAIENPISDLPAKISCDGYDITEAVREEAIGKMASQASALTVVRQAVLQYQRDFRRFPGLVADGRDMGTVVFPDATLKFFFDADPLERAKRRHRQLQHQGINVSLRDIQEDLLERDRRDRDRPFSPTKPAVGAIIIDTTDLSVDEVFARVLQIVHQQGLSRGFIQLC
jgi:cytidylate kinase